MPFTIEVLHLVYLNLECVQHSGLPHSLVWLQNSRVDCMMGIVGGSYHYLQSSVAKSYLPVTQADLQNLRQAYIVVKGTDIISCQHHVYTFDAQ